LRRRWTFKRGGIGTAYKTVERVVNTRESLEHAGPAAAHDLRGREGGTQSETNDGDPENYINGW
jgi:hypothetical protein